MQKIHFGPEACVGKCESNIFLQNVANQALQFFGRLNNTKSVSEEGWTLFWTLDHSMHLDSGKPSCPDLSNL